MTYLFDFDGTLVDSMPTFGKMMLRILDEHNVAYPADIIKIITPLGLEGTAKYFVKMGLNQPVEQIQRLMGKYLLDAYVNDIPAKENVIGVLKQLKDRGDSLNVLTASPHLTLDPCLRRLQIYDLFDNVWSCDDFGTTKADPEIYRQAAERMGTTVEQVLFLDDNYNANKTAKKAGMGTCGVFDETSRDYIAQMQELTDYYIFNFTELLTLR